MTRTAKTAAAMLTVGVLSLLLAEAAPLQVAAAMLILAGVGVGVFAIATPEFIAGDREDGT